MREREIDSMGSCCGNGCVLVVSVVTLGAVIIAVICNTVESIKRVRQEELNPTPPKVFDIGEHVIKTECKVEDGQKPMEEDFGSHQGYEVTSMEKMHDNIAGSHNLYYSLHYDTYKIEWRNNEPVLCKYDAWDGGYTDFCPPVRLVESGEMLEQEDPEDTPKKLILH